MSGLQNWMTGEWCHELEEGILKENWSFGGSRRERGTEPGTKFKEMFLKTSNPFSLVFFFFLVFYYGTQDRIWYSVVTSSNSETNHFHLAKVTFFFLHLICICLRLIMCSIPYLMNISVKSLVSKATPSLYRSQYTENPHSSNP